MIFTWCPAQATVKSLPPSMPKVWTIRITFLLAWHKNMDLKHEFMWNDMILIQSVPQTTDKSYILSVSKAVISNCRTFPWCQNVDLRHGSTRFFMGSSGSHYQFIRLIYSQQLNHRNYGCLTAMAQEHGRKTWVLRNLYDLHVWFLKTIINLYHQYSQSKP